MKEPSRTNQIAEKGECKVDRLFEQWYDDIDPVNNAGGEGAKTNADRAKE